MKESESKSADPKPALIEEYESDTLDCDIVTYASEDEGFSTEDTNKATFGEENISDREDKLEDVSSPILEDEEDMSGDIDDEMDQSFEKAVSKHLIEANDGATEKELGVNTDEQKSATIENDVVEDSDGIKDQISSMTNQENRTNMEDDKIEVLSGMFIKLFEFHLINH